MSSTDIRKRDLYNEISTINSINGSSDVPTSDNQALVYDSTSEYLTPRDIVTLDADNTFSGDVSFEGGIRIGSDGTLITRIRHFDINTGGMSSTTTTRLYGLNFPQNFNTIPRVFVTVRASEPRMNCVVYNLSTSTVTLAISKNTNANVATVHIYLLLLETS